MRFTITLFLMLALAGALLAQGAKPPERLGAEAEAAGDELFNANDKAGAAVKYDEAISHFQQAQASGIPMDTEMERVNEKLFKAYYFSKQYMKAIEALEAKMAANPRDYKTVKTIAQLYDQKLGQTDRAIDRLVVFDAANPSFSARKRIAGYYYEQEQMREALEWYQKATELKTDANTIQKIAAIYRELGDNASAVKAYEDFLTTDPTESQKVQTYTNMGALYEGMQNFPKAIASYESVLGLKYDSKVATKLMVLYFDQGDWDKSMAKVNLILSNSAGDETAIYYRAQIKVKLGDKPGAIADFKLLQNSAKFGADAKANIKALQG
ncbi:MAG: tetratricopeptide repeat protein [Candidatus Cloacimonetes bacterium]|nr:tetratricopeptide repeat protein [Candidatus Cloacimonadota bacterium]